MQSPSLVGAGVIYAGLVLNFYHLSDGFQNPYTHWYCIWKIVPIVFLALFSYFNGGGAKYDVRLLSALGLIFGAIGDYLIGIAPEGLVFAAVSFGIGHILYMTQFFGNPITLHRPSLWTICAWNTLIGIVCLVPWLLEHFVGVSILILYSFLLSATLVVSISQYLAREPNEDPHPLLARLIGFGLFYFSDSILIIGRTLWRFPHTDVLCLSTYYAAQYFILYSNILHSFAKKLQ